MLSSQLPCIHCRGKEYRGKRIVLAARNVDFHNVLSQRAILLNDDGGLPTEPWIRQDSFEISLILLLSSAPTLSIEMWNSAVIKSFVTPAGRGASHLQLLP